jgi:hypothetical protein
MERLLFVFKIGTALIFPENSAKKAALGLLTYC